LDLCDPLYRDALRYHLRAAGFTEVFAEGDANAVVTDRQSGGDLLSTILVVEPTPAAARLALSRLASGLAMSLLPGDDPEAVIVTLEHMPSGVLIHERVLALAAAMPEMSTRQLALLENLISGCTLNVIASFLDVSPATVKRELRELGDRLHAGSRTELVARAAALGVGQRPGTPEGSIAIGGHRPASGRSTR
jgi:DNA-binding CsgD family transcriptional regulator